MSAFAFSPIFLWLTNIFLCPRAFYGWVPRASNLWKNKKFEYAHQILDSNNIEPPIPENHNRMQIITSFAYYMNIINFIACIDMSRFDNKFEFVLKF